MGGHCTADFTSSITDGYIADSIVNAAFQNSFATFEFFQACGFACSGRANDVTFDLAFLAIPTGKLLGFVGGKITGVFAKAPRVTSLQKRGFEIVNIGGRPFAEGTFNTSVGQATVGGFVSATERNITFTQGQVFFLGKASPFNPGARVNLDLARQFTNSLSGTGFNTVTFSGTRLTGATAGQLKMITRPIP